MLDRLESSVNQIKRFTADASHELRGPLTFARTVAEIALKDPGTDAASRAAFQDIVDEAAKAAIMLEEMLTLARADAAPANLVRMPVDLALIVREVCKATQPRAAEQGLHLSLVTNTATASILGDAAALKRLVWILLDNAIKYSKPNGTIRVRLNLLADRATVEVEDDGIGIAPADLPLIFDRFYRADPSRGLVEGNDLGLAIAQWIAETHKAQLAVQSEPWHGSVFQLTFPRLSALEVPSADSTIGLELLVENRSVGGNSQQSPAVQ